MSGGLVISLSQSGRRYRIYTLNALSSVDTRSEVPSGDLCRVKLGEDTGYLPLALFEETL